MTSNAETYKSMLRSQPQVVSFTKKDGTTRIMKCTLDPEFIDGVYDFAEHGRKQNDEVISVWDLEADAWRSFRVDSVEKIRPFTEKELDDLANVS